MATVYLRSTDGDDADDGSTWALAKATWISAIAAAGAGGIIYASMNHAEIISGVTVTGGDSVANTILVLGVDDSGDPEPPTSLVTKDSTNHPKIQFNDAVNINGFFYFYGPEFHTDGASANDKIIFCNTGSGLIIFEQSYLNNTSIGSGAVFQIGGGSNANYQRVVELVNTDYTTKINSSTGSGFNINAGGALLIRGGALVGAMNNSAGVLFGCTQSADRSARVDVADSDVSAMSSTQYLFIQTNKADCHVEFKRLKTPATFNPISASDFQHSIEPPFKLHGYGNADTYYSFLEESAEGSAEEDTAIYRDGGGTYDGTNGFSVKMASTIATLEAITPLRVKLSELRLDLASAKTLTAHIVQDGGVVLQDDEFWLEIEHPDHTDLALGVFSQEKIADILATPANLSASTETWTGDSGGADHRKVVHTIAAITGADNAAVTVWACLAKPSTTIYCCPKVEVS